MDGSLLKNWRLFSDHKAGVDPFTTVKHFLGEWAGAFTTAVTRDD